MYGYVWLCMAMYVYAWLCMAIHGYVFMALHAMHGYVWLCMYGYVCMYNILGVKRNSKFTSKSPCQSAHKASQDI